MLKGLPNLLDSKKGTLCLIVLGCATTGLLMGKLDGTAYAAIIGTISTIFMWTSHKQSIAELGIKNDS